MSNYRTCQVLFYYYMPTQYNIKTNYALDFYAFTVFLPGELQVKAKFERGGQEIREGKGISHKEAKQRLQKWVK